MAISFFQQNSDPSLTSSDPSLTTIRNKHKKFNNPKFPPNHSNNLKAEVNLGIYLIKFFELYGQNFNYKKVGISLEGINRKQKLYLYVYDK